MVRVIDTHGLEAANGLDLYDHETDGIVFDHSDEPGFVSPDVAHQRKQKRQTRPKIILPAQKLDLGLDMEVDDSW